VEVGAGETIRRQNMPVQIQGNNIFRITMANEKPRKRTDVVYRSVDEGGLLVDIKNKMVHSLNVTANFIWELCDGNHSCQDISEKLRERFDTENTDSLKDIERVIDTFRKNRLLENT